jgi:hypothetical protein
MRKILFALLLVLSFSANATESILGKFYVTNLPARVLLCNYVG